MRQKETSLSLTAFIFTLYALMGIGVGGAVATTGAITPQMGGLMAFCVFLGLFQTHAMVARKSVDRSVQNDLKLLKDSTRNLHRDMEATKTGLEGLRAQVETETTKRSDELVGEVKMLEGLIKRMGESFEHRLGDLARTPAVAAHPARNTMLEAVREALTHNRVDLYLQPIVNLPQRKTVFYESFSRLRDGADRVIMPAEYLKVAEPAGLVGTIDNLLLFRCVQIVRRLAKQDRQVGVFCNISHLTLKDETFFPQFLEFMRENRDLAGSVIFELGQAAFETRGSVEARNMAKLADLGFAFSIDKTTSLKLDMADLNRSDVRFVKFSADTLMGDMDTVDGAPRHASMPDIHAADIAALYARYGIELIAEKIETEQQAVETVDLDIRYGQGHLFGAPRPVRDQVLNEAPATHEGQTPAPMMREAAA